MHEGGELTVGDSAKASHSAVAVTRCEDYDPQRVYEAVVRQFTLAAKGGGDDRGQVISSGSVSSSAIISRGDRVLIKPNLIIARRSDEPVQTHPAVITAVARAVKDLGGKPFVADSPAWGTVKACAGALELYETLKGLDVPVSQLKRPTRISVGPCSVGISRDALEADRIINVPKLKTHQQLGATFAIKNIFGCVCGKEKAYLHFSRGKDVGEFCEMLVGIFKLLRPAMTIIDGVVGMEGAGPINGRARKLGFLVGGADPVACELICCELLGLAPEDLPILQAGRRLGLGCGEFERVNVVGDDYRDLICTDFEPAEGIPLKFSLFRVCR
ncbi:MAG: DUF362 domain-containing protein, partial [Planctomycetes bacterium]|nr:DUF362 domain-containing protein [Planctomycetota bacterium]